MKRLFLTAALLLAAGPALAAEADMYWLGGTSSTGAPIWIPVTSAHPMPTSGGGLTVGAPIQGTCGNGFGLFNNSGVLGCEAFSGAGTVTSITAGTGIALSPSPITASGSVSLANTAVTPGAYTNANITVDQQGRITVAANGTGGGITALTGDVTASGSGSVAATVAKIAGVAVGTPTGTGNVVFSTSPTFVTPALGTPASGVATNLTGTAASLTAGTATVANGLKSATTTVVVSAATAPTAGQVLTATAGTSADWETLSASAASFTPGTTTILGATAPCVLANTTSTTSGCVAETGTGSVVLATSPTLITPALGTPSALILTNATGLPVGGITGLGTGVGTALAAAVTGSGSIVLATSPTLVTPVLGTVAAGSVLTNATGLPISTGVSGLGTSIATALGVNVGSAGAPVLFNGAGGTPSAIVLTSGTGLPISTGVSGLGTGVATAAGNGVNTAGGVVTSAGTVTATIPIAWDSNTTVANATIPVMLPPWTTAGGTITSVKYYTNGGTPSFTADVTIGGTGVTGCNAIAVSSATPATATCTAANTFTSSSSIALVITGVSGTPNTALVQINFTHTLN